SDSRRPSPAEFTFGGAAPRTSTFRGLRPPSSLRLVSGLPLDIAADARFLLGARAPSEEQRRDGGTRVLPGDGHVVPRPTVVELPVIGELAFGIENVQVRRTRSAECARDGL